MLNLPSVVNAESNLIALCPNCHWEFDNEKRITINNKCLDCQKPCSKTSLRCRSCASLYREQSKKPSKQQLESDFLELSTFKKVSQKYNVSICTVRNWCKYYNFKI